MDTKRVLQHAIDFAAVLLVTGSGLAQTVDPSSITYGDNILKVSNTDQIKFVQSALDRGLPTELGDTLAMLVLNKSTLTLPLIEKKIEEVLASPDPSRCCTTEEINPPRFIDLPARTIDYAGDTEALKQVAKLMAIDEQRFGQYVPLTIHNAEERRNGNPFAVAYAGLQIGSPALSRKIITWVEAELPGKTDSRRGQLRRWWGQAMLNRYGGRVAAENGWNDDPIASRLSSSLTLFVRDEVLHSVAEEAEKRGRQ